MKCPTCGAQMENGMVRLKPTLLGWLVFGWSYKHVYFEGANKGALKQNVILKNGKTKQGFQCGSCGAALIMPE